ncbi:MAG: chitobiase/beta-hexosaminidase C-terminal domain-containing protein [Prevotella sp.]|nr:chitobiase/beta-hexosaminidase C-terminal domain-containing protein [Prevotella sp.]
MACPTTGANIYYTLDGTTPTSSSTHYTSAFTLSKSATVKAIAIKGDISSEVTEASYILKPQTPYINVQTGTYNNPQNVSIYCNGPNGAVIYYTTDGSDPTSSPTRIHYSGSFTISANTTIKAVAEYGEFDTSDMAQSDISLEVGTPTFSPAGGTYTSTQSVSITSATPNATIHYTLDGTTPTASSPVYSSPLSIAETTTVKAIAMFGEMTPSEVAEATYTIREISSDVFVKASSVTELADGMEVIIVHEDQNVNYTFGEQQSNNFKATTISLDKTSTPYTATPGNDAKIFILEGNNTDGWMFNLDDKYLFAAGASSNNYLRTTDDPDEKAIASISISSGNATIQFHNDGNRNIIRYNKSSALFSCYASGQENVQIYYRGASLTLPRPTITPATGTYTSAQTVTITNNAEGATVYYTTDGSTPTASSTEYTAPFILKKNGTHTVKAIAINGDEKSSIETSIITINIEIDAPVFTEASGTTFAEPYTIHLTGPEGCTIYYTTGSEDPIDENGDLTGAAIAYNAATGIANLAKATTINAVAVNGDGNASDVATASYSYNGTVNVPYYENFDESLGNFTTEYTGTVPPQWFVDKHDDEAFIATYGEARHYARVDGRDKVGTARLISPLIDLTDDLLESVSMSFVHAGHWFGTKSGNTFIDDQEIKEKECHLCIKRETDATWTEITIPNWFEQTLNSSGKAEYNRTNSGEIDLSSYIGDKIQISFFFDVSNETLDAGDPHGNWNVLRFSVTATKGEEENYEIVNMKTDGYVTYVVQHDIDWQKTMESKANEGKTIMGYKVTEFSEKSAVFAAFGVGENETLIPAETPIILKGMAGENKLVIATASDLIAKPKNNLLRPSYGEVVAQESQHLLVFQKSADWTATDPYNNYGFYKLATGRTIPERKAYLNSIDVSEELTQTTNAAKGVFLLEDLGNEDFYQGEATAISTVDVAPRANGIYDLSGRRMEAKGRLQKGIYIVNGKKIVVK